MARHRLGIVLLVPQPLATEIDGIRRALGDSMLPRVAPHVTLVPPVNVAQAAFPEALAIVRRAAAATAPFAFRLGPVVTFAPVTPVAYLAVDGSDEEHARLAALRDALLVGPLDRPQDHPFVPHCTVASELSEERLASVAAVLADVSAPVTFDRIQVLEQQPDRTWPVIADAPLGIGASTVARGSLPLELVVSERVEPAAEALLARAARPAPDDGVPSAAGSAAVPMAVTAARRDGEVVAAAWGWAAGPVGELAELVVSEEHRGVGIGRHVLTAVEHQARQRGVELLGAWAPADGAAAALLAGAGWAMVDGAGLGGVARWARRWERDAPSPS